MFVVPSSNTTSNKINNHKKNQNFDTASYLQDGARLVLLDPLGHHVEDVVHDRRSQLKVKVTLNSLFRHRLGNACDSIVLLSHHQNTRD